MRTRWPWWWWGRAVLAKQRAHGAANRVRIIGGQYRRRLLDFHDSTGLRPTPDRVRETLFNWLGQDLPGWTCLDLFAGSGALGFEAASRGAQRVVMIELDPKAISALEKNRALLDASAVDILRVEALAWLKTNHETFDLIFVDPPFDSGLAARSDISQMPPAAFTARTISFAGPRAEPASGAAPCRNAPPSADATPAASTPRPRRVNCRAGCHPAARW